MSSRHLHVVLPLLNMTGSWSVMLQGKHVAEPIEMHISTSQSVTIEPQAVYLAELDVALVRLRQRQDLAGALN